MAEAMPSIESVQLYPGLCLFEAPNLSVGRGTATPFQLVGAPWLDHVTVVRELARHVPLGAEFDAADFTPTVGPHATERCHGIRVHVTDAHGFRPVTLGLHMDDDRRLERAGARGALLPVMPALDRGWGAPIVSIDTDRLYAINIACMRYTQSID